MNTIELSSCTKHKCTRCDIVYILMNYITPLMQCLSNDIKEYNMQLLTTKCLNTAVMLMFFLLGKKGLKHAQYCDSQSVIERHQQGKDNNNDVLSKMNTAVLKRPVKYRYLYYILMNDGYFNFDGNNEGRIYFPGHVFIIEKIPYNNNVYYNLYQSYINEYDLKGFFKNNKTLRYKIEEIKDLLDKLKYIINNDSWDDKCIQYWKDFTHVDTTYMKGAVQKDKLFICCSFDKVKSCIKNIKQYATLKLDEIEKHDKLGDTTNIYGDKHIYNNPNIKPLTYNEIANNLRNILNDIQRNRNSS